MATSDPPDPRNLESWEDAFQHPIPAVRGMEKKLRTGALENHDKLKDLVSVSYRDLLGTARTIIDADKQMREVEKLLGHVSKKCDSRVLDKISANHSHLEKYNSAKKSNQYTLASQLFVIQKSLAVVSRLLRTRGSTLLAAKLLVVARLLHKTLSSSAEVNVVKGSFGDRLVSLRQRLLRHIDRRFERSYPEVSSLVEDMTAFSLATSSSPSDVLRHFQHLRLEVIKRPLEDGAETAKGSIIKRLQVFLDTQRETKTLYPELFQASLKTLSTRTLLDDPDIRALDELGLDNHLQWLAGEVKNFTPWTRHDELQKTKATQSLGIWAREGLKALVEQLRQDINLESDMGLLAVMRTDMLQMWLANAHLASGISSRGALSEMRLCFVSRFKDLIGQMFSNLHTNTTEQISKTLEEWNPDVDIARGLWDPYILSMDISNGASAFRTTIVDRRLGRHYRIGSIVTAYDSSVKGAETVQEIITQMREIRWDQADDLSDDEFEEEGDEAQPPQRLLSREDPDAVQNALRDSAVAFAANIEAFFSANIAEPHLVCSQPTAAGLYVLRLLRELRRRLPLLLQTIDKDAAQRLMCADLVSKLHASLAGSVQTKAAAALATALDRYVRSARHVESLWDGASRPLPVQITPATFRALRATLTEMEGMGADVWTPGAVAALRGALDVAFGGAFADVIESLDGAAQLSNGTDAGARNAAAAATHENEEESEAAEKEGQGAESTAEETDRGEATRSTSDEADADAKHSEAPNATAGDEGGDDKPHKPAPRANDAANGNVDDAAARRSKAVQLLFDAIYVSHALASSGEGRLGDAITSLTRRSGLDDDEAALVRLRKGAAEYWRRTYLLFGLLAGPA